MQHFRSWQFPIVAAALWGVAAWFSLALRDGSQGVLLLWLPSAVAVAALASSPRKGWPPILLALVFANFAVSLLRGIPLGNSFGFGMAQVVEASLCVAIGRRVLGSHATPQTFRHLAGLFGAALAGSAAGTLVAIPFRIDTGILQYCWWFLATTLGILVGTPMLVYLRQSAGFGGRRSDLRQGARPALIGSILGGFFALSFLVLRSDQPLLVPLIFCALIFAVLRAGQMGAAAGVFAFAVAATIEGRMGLAPVQDVFAASLVLQGLMLLMLAMSLPLAAALLARTQLEDGLRTRNAQLKDSLTILNLAKTLAGIGRWQLDLKTGKQDWSEQMLEMNGLPPELAPDPGDVRDLLPDGGEELFGKLAEYRDARIPYSFEYHVRPPGQEERILRLNAINEFENGRRVAIFAVAMDVTEQIRREEALRAARKEAVERAAEAQKLANTDSLTGLANRRATLDWLERLLEGSLEAEEPISILMFDIDHFKRINDTLGHQAGDEVLRRVAEIARAQLRAEDLVGRIGGEEFVCILPGLSGSAAAALAGRLCRSVADKSASAGLPRTTISVGMALGRPGDTSESLIARADEALYAAKNAGRNQVREAA